MVKLLFCSSNSLFATDLQMQLQKLLPDVVWNNENPDIVIIDENHAQQASLRRQHPNIPFILLTTDKSYSSDTLNTFFSKPFSLSDLINHICTANNLLDNSAIGFLLFNDYELRPNSREILDITDGSITKLTEKEVSILKYLYKTSAQYVSKADLQTNVWEYNEEATTHTVETHIYRLRQKVEKENGRRLILTESGGYKLNLG